MTASRVLTSPRAATPASKRWAAAVKRAEKHAIAVKHLGGEVWQAGSASRPGESYVVIVRDGDPVSCTCVGGYGDRTCQHKAAVWLQLQVEAGWDEMAEGMAGG